MVKIAVLVSGGGTNLQALIDAEKNKIIKSGKISLVISNKSDAYALTRAKNNGIKTSAHRRRNVFKRNGWLRSYTSNEKGFFGFFHGLGHGVGLEIHEEPRLSRKVTHLLQAGEVVTIEPGVYYPEWGGIRLEDIAVVREDSCECLTTIDTFLEID